MMLPKDLDIGRVHDDVGRRLLRLSGENYTGEWQGSDPFYIAYVLYVSHGKTDVTPYLDNDPAEVRKRQQAKLVETEVSTLPKPEPPISAVGGIGDPGSDVRFLSNRRTEATHSYGRG